ncbi:chromo domain-containing protein cec-3 [Drosophila eugracilis]|uniref:chromo domain-containing protein cec-3 n=1 Tax=Drosophila eugracilis TaxID=29029 RepID=UPI0007E61E0C|nr:chromo domain-containing protein cec-3 [Drosophila eugracilis]
MCDKIKLCGSSAEHSDDAEEYIVEKIIGQRFIEGRPMALVKWKGFPEEANSWEPLENLHNCMKLFCDFQAALYKQQQKASSNHEELITGLLMTDNSHNRPVNAKKKSESNQKENSSANASRKSKANKKEEAEVNKPSISKESIKNLPTTSENIHGDNGPNKIFKSLQNKCLSESSDEENLAATPLPDLQAGSPKRHTALIPKALDLQQQGKPLIESPDSLLHQKPCQDESISSDSEDSSSSSSSSSIRSSSPGSLTSSSSSSKSAEKVPKIISLDQLKGDSRKWEANKRAVKFASLTPNPTSPSSFTPKTNILHNRMLRSKTTEGPIDSELPRVQKKLTPQHTNRNIPEPLKISSEQETKSSQVLTRHMIHAGSHKVDICPDQPQTTGAKKKESNISPEEMSAQGIARSTTRSKAGGRRSEKVPDWRMEERKKLFGLKRGLELDKIVHSFQVREKLFLFVSWKGCLAIDAVLIEEIKEKYPRQIIEYFESLKIKVPE